jgi:hypothetical protein
MQREELGMTTQSTMRASPGDRLVIKGHYTGDRQRDGEILEVRGEEGAPPYIVRWEDDGHVSEFFPGSDASVEHFPRSPGEVAG